MKFESIERFNHVAIVAVAADAGAGSQPLVRVYDAETAELKFEFLAYAASYRLLYVAGEVPLMIPANSLKYKQTLCNPLGLSIIINDLS